MSAKHTPGPWRTRRGFGRDVETESGMTIAFASDRDVSARRARSNARLIAAAPDLLEALRALVEAVEDRERDSLAELLAAYAAIAKATGEKT